eukprot:Phypoly_transcript_01014.p2 GENE.Phypoly_transcript_01014~~Phypoly_transcript_01014.p2  ORF type:complete len:461 (+),score=81.77 Phypoly_transcript_01014:2396-3778(+)
MSQVITIQLGQCGNQVGGEMYQTFVREALSGKEDYRNSIVDGFFRELDSGKLVARSILIDMEPKVIAHTMQESLKSGTWEYDKNSQFSKQSGSGNNWAYGYNVHGPSTLEPIMEIVHRQVEACDSLGGFFLMQSLAGGTGSGVGTYVTEALRDEFPHSFLVNQVVWPYKTGEVIVQNYNSIMTLSHLYQVSDGIILVENDTIHTVCTKLLNIKKVGFPDMNKVIAQQLSSVLLPSYTMSSPSPSLSSPSFSSLAHPFVPSHLSLLSGLVKHMCSHSSYKLMNLKTIPQMPPSSIPFSSYNWTGLLKHLHQMLIADSNLEEGINWSIKADDPPPPTGPYSRPRARNIINRSLANLLILRGDVAYSTQTPAFSNPSLYTPWAPNPFMLCAHEKKFNNYDKMAVLLSNSQSVVHLLDSILECATSMLHSRGFIHQYEKYGIEYQDFVHSFAQLEQIVQNYRQL